MILTRLKLRCWKGSRGESVSYFSTNCIPWFMNTLHQPLHPSSHILHPSSVQFTSVQSLSHVQLFATPWIAVCQASLFITNSQNPPKPMSIESVVPSNYLILCRPLLLLSSIFPSIRVFSNESALHIRWPKYWSFSLNISPSIEHPGLISLQSKGLARVFSNTTVQKHQFFGAQLSL